MKTIKVKERLREILLQTIPARVHVDQPNIEYIIAAVDKPEIVQDGDLWWFQKSGKQNSILINSKDVTSVAEQHGTTTIMTKSGLRYQVFH